jgi:hypothetical protein
MNIMQSPWQRTLGEFAGPGIRYPSETMRIDDGEAAGILAGLSGLARSEPVHTGTGRHAGYRVRHALGDVVTALFAGDAIVGFYVGSYLWIERGHRGKGLSLPLVLAAQTRGGTALPPGVIVQGSPP